MFALAHLPPVAPACRLSQLRVGGDLPGLGVFFNGATGSLVGLVTFRNEGATCSLLGRPRVRLVGGIASSIREREAVLTGEQAAPGGPAPAFSVRALPHGRTASVEIWWSNWCGPGNAGAGRSSPPPTGVEVTLPSGGSVRQKVTEAPRCDAPQSPSTVYVGSFQPLRRG
ncbi:MAG TPA: DUF4232 domain-containing protein [Gaiellaceae bacterium]